VELGCADGHLTMRVRGWGKGFNVERALAGVAGDKRLGLMGMSERLSLVSGALDIESSPGQGSTLTARLPLRECASPPPSEPKITRRAGIGCIFFRGTALSPAEETPMTGRTHRVVVCDDHAIFRESTKQALAKNPKLVVVGEAADCFQAM
jgi:hypothetical protein